MYLVFQMDQGNQSVMFTNITRFTRKIDVMKDIDAVPSNVHSSRQEALLYVFEDNEAVIKMIIKSRSPTMRAFINSVFKKKKKWDTFPELRVALRSNQCAPESPNHVH